jgi:hypothetical protein
MDVTSAASMKREMEEMALLLKDIQGGARDLTDSSIEKLLRLKRLTVEQKREKATSAWAKSKCNRAKRNMVDKEIIPDTVVNSDVAKSEKVIRVRSASYSFGRRYQEVPKAEMGNMIYDVNIESSSTRKRVISTKFSTAGRLSDIEKNKNLSNGDSNPTDKVDSEMEVDATDKAEGSDNSDHDDVENKATKRTKKNKLKEDEKFEKLPFKSPIERSPKVYSFPKSSRETVEKGSTAGVTGDIDTAEKALRPYIMGAVMRPASVTRRVPIDDAPSEKNTIPEVASNSPDIMAHLDALSSRMRATSYTMHKDTVKTMNPAILWKVKGTPGPGDYDPDSNRQSGTGTVLPYDIGVNRIFERAVRTARSSYKFSAYLYHVGCLFPFFALLHLSFPFPSSISFFPYAIAEPKGGPVYKLKSEVTEAYVRAEYLAPKSAGPGPGEYDVRNLSYHLLFFSYFFQCF